MGIAGGMESLTALPSRQQCLVKILRGTGIVLEISGRLQQAVSVTATKESQGKPQKQIVEELFEIYYQRHREKFQKNLSSIIS